MKTSRLLLFFLLSLIPAIVNAAAPEKVPVIVELYTSQSCSSCPDADRLFTKLAQESDIITLGCHVTYWNHLNWKDTLSSEECTQRQRDFGQKLDFGRVYTPEAIVNGRAGMVGHDETAIRSAIRKQKTDAKTFRLTLGKNADGYDVIFPALPAGRQIPYVVTLLAYGDERSVKIGSGENGGETVLYTHPVILLKKLTGWNGTAQVIRIPQTILSPETKGLVVTAQAEPGSPVIAMGELKI